MNNQTSNVSPLVLKVLFRPREAFEDLARAEPSPYRVFFRYLIWFALLPPLFAYIGGSRYGWDLGAANPLILAETELRVVSALYYVVLLTAFVSTAFASQWMSETYGARKSLGVHMAMVTILAVPVTVGSAVHLYPHVFVNLLVFIPVLIWVIYLLYVGLPVALNINQERGMLMASSLVGWLLVGFVTLLGVTVVLWTNGLGPSIGA
ncbi:MAG: Yip1 family protein [bacterium]|nr:DUF1282 domain-containing protein [Gammaproteobacteria bacterium]HIL95669.1 DUF1282 domain-containing protein [Pseudomonadales bacterium]